MKRPPCHELQYSSAVSEAWVSGKCVQVTDALHVWTALRRMWVGGCAFTQIQDDRPRTQLRPSLVTDFK